MTEKGNDVADRTTEERLEDVELAFCSLMDLVFLDMDEGILMALSPDGRDRAEALIGLRHTIGMELAERNADRAEQARPDAAERERVEAALAHGSQQR